MNPEQLSPFGELLRRHRLSAGLSQERLAERAGISLAAVNTLERGVRRAPYLQTMMKLADALTLAGADRAAFMASARRFRTHATVPRAQRPEARLPVYLSSIIGRAAEVAECGTLLGSNQLVTIVGAGGIGKTRLATAVAESVAAEYQPVVFVDLARAPNDDLFALQIAAAFGLDAISDATERVATALGDTPALIVLDNCEQVIEAAARFAATLLQRCQDVRILATSRERLAIGGEQVFRVGPMDAAAALEYLSSEEALWIHTSSSAIRFWRRPKNSYAGSTDCRWQSNLRRRDCRRLVCRSSAGASTCNWVYPVSVAMRPTVTEQSRPRLHGAISSSTPPKGRS
jgi:transcriptional regulator with XRE-family HTH domain